jgi:hypothetical protein
MKEVLLKLYGLRGAATGRVVGALGGGAAGLLIAGPGGAVAGAGVGGLAGTVAGTVTGTVRGVSAGGAVGVSLVTALVLGPRGALQSIAQVEASIREFLTSESSEIIKSDWLESTCGS